MEKKCKTCNGEIEVDGFSECWRCIGWVKEEAPAPETKDNTFQLIYKMLEQEEEISQLRRALKETEVFFSNQVKTNFQLYQDNQLLKKRIKELEK